MNAGRPPSSRTLPGWRRMAAFDAGCSAAYPPADLARRRVAQLGVPRARVRPLVRRVGAGRDRLGADRRGTPRRRHLQRYDAPQVGLERQHVHRVVPAARHRRVPQPTAVGPVARGGHQRDGPTAGRDLPVTPQDPPPVPPVGAVRDPGDALARRWRRRHSRAPLRGSVQRLPSLAVGEGEPRPRPDEQVVGGVGGRSARSPGRRSVPASSRRSRRPGSGRGSAPGGPPPGAPCGHPVPVPVAVPADGDGGTGGAPPIGPRPGRVTGPGAARREQGRGTGRRRMEGPSFRARRCGWGAPRCARDQWEHLSHHASQRPRNESG